jgi:hypothetical protein
MPANVVQFFRQFPDDDACLAQVFDSRYGQGHVCPKCERAAKWYKIKSARAYACQWCGWHITPPRGRCLRTAARRFALVLRHLSVHHLAPRRSRQGTATAARRHLQDGVAHGARDQGSTWPRWTARSRCPGIVEVDETYVGGHRPGKPGRGAAGKTIIVGMIERDGDVVTKVVPNVRKGTVEPIIEANVEKGSTVHTDELASYRASPPRATRTRR